MKNIHTFTGFDFPISDISKKMSNLPFAIARLLRVQICIILKICKISIIPPNFHTLSNPGPTKLIVSIWLVSGSLVVARLFCDRTFASCANLHNFENLPNLPNLPNLQNLQNFQNFQNFHNSTKFPHAFKSRSNPH